jgi:hypothetical protein
MWPGQKLIFFEPHVKISALSLRNPARDKSSVLPCQFCRRNTQCRRLSASLPDVAVEPPEEDHRVLANNTLPGEDYVSSIHSGSDIQNIQSRKTMDETINSAFIGFVLVVFALWLYHIDASLPHPAESDLQSSLTRVPIEAWETYRNSLLDSPIATKAGTSASVYAIGDVISQRTEGATLGDIDRSRTLRSLVAGLVGHGPLSHFWYIYLDNFFNNVLHMTEWWSFIPKVLFDQTTVGTHHGIKNQAWESNIGIFSRD